MTTAVARVFACGDVFACIAEFCAGNWDELTELRTVNHSFERALNSPRCLNAWRMAAFEEFNDDNFLPLRQHWSCLNKYRSLSALDSLVHQLRGLATDCRKMEREYEDDEEDLRDEYVERRRELLDSRREAQAEFELRAKRLRVECAV